MRVGIGYDAHRLAEGRPLVLGGVTVAYEKGLAGHSDADVVAHALMDALLGGARLGDIGEMFPDTDPRWAGSDSILLLEAVATRVRDAGWLLEDADCVVVCEAPKLAPHRDAMRRRLAEAVGVEADRIGLRATTTEGMGFEGRGEGISAHAVVLLAPA